MRRGTNRAKRKPYAWDDKRGVLSVDKSGNTWQQVQIICGGATQKFRIECGQILVAALNRKEAKNGR